MSNPSFSNIDRWLFELMEGNLSPEQVAQLEAFLIRHPELDVDKDMWELAKVDSQEVEFPNQEKLFRRKPVGLYMSLGFASIVILLGLGVNNYQKQYSDTINFAKNIGNSTSTKQLGDLKVGMFTQKIKGGIQANISVNKNQISIVASNEGFTNNNSESFGNNNNLPNYTNLNSSVFESREFIVDPVIGNNSNNTIQKTNTIIKPERVRQIEIKKQERGVTYHANSYSNGLHPQKSTYKISFHSKLNKFGRSVQRMLDNPVALKNKKDPYYHIPGMQAMDINFGSVGTMLATRVQSVSRAQWLGEDNQQFMNQLSIDGYSYGMRGGLGFQFNHNYYGKGGIENYHASLIYSPKLSVSRNVNVEPSIRFKMGSKLLNSNQIEAGSTVEYDRGITQAFYSNGETPIGSSLWYKDLGLGLMVNTKWFFVGVQGDNLLEHYDNIYSNDLSNPRRAGKHFVATIGTDYESKKEIFIVSPYLVYQKMESLSEAWLGVNMGYRWLTIGAAVSSNLEPAASIGLKFDHFMLTYNADYTRSDMLMQSPLSHQLTIRFLTKPSRSGQRLLNQ